MKNNKFMCPAEASSIATVPVMEPLDHPMKQIHRNPDFGLRITGKKASIKSFLPPASLLSANELPSGTRN